MTEQPEQPADGVETAAPVPATPEVVPASGTLPAADADIVGTYSAPNPGAQPGEVAEQPLVAQSAADPDPQASIDANKADAKDPIQTADDQHPEDTAKGSTDPAVHNPRAPLDGSGVGNDGQPLVAARVEEDRTDEEIDSTNNARRGIPTGPAHTQHSGHTAHRKLTRPTRRDEV